MVARRGRWTRSAGSDACGVISAGAASVSGQDRLLVFPIGFTRHFPDFLVRGVAVLLLGTGGGPFRVVSVVLDQAELAVHCPAPEARPRPDRFQAQFRRSQKMRTVRV